MSAPGKVRPKVDLDATVERLIRLGLGHRAEHLADCLAHSAKAELPAHAFLDRLLDIELNEREERRVKTSLRLSGLPTGHSWDRRHPCPRPVLVEPQAANPRSLDRDPQHREAMGLE